MALGSMLMTPIAYSALPNGKKSGPQIIGLTNIMLGCVMKTTTIHLTGFLENNITINFF